MICAVEFIGPCRFAGWAMVDMPDIGVSHGEPVAKENPTAWVQIAAVSMFQTRNTMRLFPTLFNEACKKRHDMNKQSMGKEIIYAHRGARVIEAVTSSPKSLEGGRASFVCLNETHWWLESNNGHEMAAVIERNATKSKGGAARTLAITNAYEEGMDSVAERTRTAWEEEHAGLTIDTGVMYDSLEVGLEVGLAPPEAKAWGEASSEAEAQWRERVVKAYLAVVLEVVRGDAWWLDVPRLVASILDARNPASRSRRFWFNQVAAQEDAWVDPAAVDAGEDALAVSARRGVEGHFAQIEAGWIVDPREPIVMFFDGSKSDDATALVGCRLSDGYTFLIGVWQPPRDKDIRRHKWVIDRNEVSKRVDVAMGRFNIVGFWGDPSHAQDDADETRFWDGTFDVWHRRYASKLRKNLHAVKSGDTQHSIMWDMTSPTRHAQFVAAAERTREEIMHKIDEDALAYEPTFTHDGHPALKAHLKNARAKSVTLPGGALGTTVRKGGRESAKKIDIGVCVIGARMLRRIALNAVEEEKTTEDTGWAFTA